MQQSSPMIPNLPSGIQTLYLDCETTSRDCDKKSVNPWHNCWPAGYAITWDDHPEAYYLPVGHADGFGTNLDINTVHRFIQDAVDRSRVWVNHNVKYDMHVLHRAGLQVRCPVVDTVTQAKLIDSDRQYRGGYGLDALARDWLGIDIAAYEEAMQPYLPKKGKYKNKDYGRIPVDVIGPYAKTDVLIERKLWRYIQENLPEGSKQVSDTENRVTAMLAEIEQTGIRVDPVMLLIYFEAIHRKLLDIEARVHEIAGRAINCGSDKQLREFLIGEMGLPVIEYTDAGQASLGKDILKQYKEISPETKEIVSLLLDYRSLAKSNSSFVGPYIDLHDNGIIHPTYNQAVSTGRMSCSEPNMQQLSSFAKQLFIPREGMAYLLVDYSQIEFRLIAHFIQDTTVINAYQSDPLTDYHNQIQRLVAEVFPDISRREAKVLNFMLGYGGGKKKTVKILGQFGNQLYSAYHKKLPNLRSAINFCSRMIKERADNEGFGYITNLYGRRRRLPAQIVLPTGMVVDNYRGFNSLCQSTAADLMKERAVDSWEFTRDVGKGEIRMLGLVHDSVIYEGPQKLLREKHWEICQRLQQPTVSHKLRVPIIVDAEIATQDLTKGSKIYPRRLPTGGKVYASLIKKGSAV